MEAREIVRAMAGSVLPHLCDHDGVCVVCGTSTPYALETIVGERFHSHVCSAKCAAVITQAEDFLRAIEHLKVDGVHSEPAGDRCAEIPR